MEYENIYKNRLNENTKLIKDMINIIKDKENIDNNIYFCIFFIFILLILIIFIHYIYNDII